MKAWLKSVEDWLAEPKVSPEDKAYLRDLQTRAQNGDAQARHLLEDAFARELTFGTSGLRGLVGPGNQRMNLHTVTKASAGLARYLQDRAPGALVCLAFDNREDSLAFAQLCGRILCSQGFQVALFDRLAPTPLLSFAVREMRAAAGVMITASHNPWNYNGFKVYGPEGAQLSGPDAEAYLDALGLCQLFATEVPMTLEEAQDAGLWSIIPERIRRSYLDGVKGLIRRKALVANHARELRVLYTPLYGTGAEPVRLVMEELGFEISYVTSQMDPDPLFPETPYPNPEKEQVFDISREIARRAFPDLLLATDPDCDRLGVMVRTPQGTYQMLTGNQQGLLLCHYLLAHLKESRPERLSQSQVYATVVSTPMIERLCQDFGASFEATLPGFKYMAEKIEALFQEGTKGFLMAMEESNGYLVGDLVRDKDGLVSLVLMAEMALYYKRKDLNLLEALEQIYQAHGWWQEETLFFAYPQLPPGEDQKHMRQILTRLRLLKEEEDPLLSRILAGGGVCEIRDYLKGPGPGANLLKLEAQDGSWLALRPSGTEARLKIYCAAQGRSLEESRRRLDQLVGMGHALAGSQAQLV